MVRERLFFAGKIFPDSRKCPPLLWSRLKFNPCKYSACGIISSHLKRWFQKDPDIVVLCFTRPRLPSNPSESLAIIFTWLFQKYMWEHFCNRKSERVLFCPVKLLFRAYCIESKCLRQELIFVKFRLHPSAQKIKFSIKNFFSKWNQIRSIWSHLLMKSLIKNFVLRMCVAWWLMN